MRSMLVCDIETFAIDDAEQYIEPVDAPGNYKDPIKIAEYVATATQKAIERCALDPDLGRIVALGWVFADDSVPTVHVCQTEADERSTLKHFWRESRDTDLVTFAGLKFDLPFLMRRSLYLRVEHPILNVNKYRTTHVDLLSRLTHDGLIQGHSLRFYLSRFGIAHDDLVSGKDVDALVRAGQWADVAAHCKADVLGTQALAKRIGAIRTREMIA